MRDDLVMPDLRVVRESLALQVEAERLDDGTYIVAVTGEVDPASSAKLERVIDDVLNNAATGLVVDLTECSFIDSTGVAVLVNTCKRTNGSMRALSLVSSGRQMVKVLEITGISGILETHPSRADALAEATASRQDETTRRTFVRSANERLERAIAGRGPNDAERFEFLCECGNRSCTSMVDLTLNEYEAARGFPARFVIARNHENPEDERVISENARFGIVETVTSELAKAAMEGNPRWQRGEPW